LIKYFTEFGNRVNVCWYHDPNPLCRNYRRRQLLRFLRDSDVLYLRLNHTVRLDSFSLLKLIPGVAKPLVWELNAVPDNARFSGLSASYVNRITCWHRFLAQFVDAGIAHTPDQAGYLRSVGVRDVSAIHLGTDTGVLRPEMRSESFRQRFDDRFLVVWAGKTLGRWNDLQTLLWAARILEQRRRDIAFVIVGDTSGLPAILPSNVCRIGPTPYSRMGSVLASCDCGVLYYRLEHGYDKRSYSPLKLYDYMATGLPVLAQRSGPVAGHVRQGETGLLLDGTPDSLAAGVEMLADDPQLVRRMGQSARRWAEREFDWRQVIARKLDVIERAVQRKRGLALSVGVSFASDDYTSWREQTSGAVVEPRGNHELAKPPDGGVDRPGGVVAPQPAGAR
jgi:glycosyltransferase involved in cell wall biosynthesis